MPSVMRRRFTLAGSSSTTKMDGGIAFSRCESTTDVTEPNGGKNATSLARVTGHRRNPRLHRHRQGDYELGAGVIGGGEHDRAAVLIDGIPRDGEAEARAGRLGGEERIEDHLALGRENAGTIVANANFHRSTIT